MTEMNEGRKDDAGKLPYHLLPSDAVEEILKVLGMVRLSTHHVTGRRAWHGAVRSLP